MDFIRLFSRAFGQFRFGAQRFVTVKLFRPFFTKTLNSEVETSEDADEKTPTPMHSAMATIDSQNNESTISVNSGGSSGRYFFTMRTRSSTGGSRPARKGSLAIASGEQSTTMTGSFQSQNTTPAQFPAPRLTVESAPENDESTETLGLLLSDILSGIQRFILQPIARGLHEQPSVRAKWIYPCYLFVKSRCNVYNVLIVGRECARGDR